MTDLVTRPFPLSFWSDMLLRIDGTYADQRGRLATLLSPREATFESANLTLTRAAQDREQALKQLATLESLQTWRLELFKVITRQEVAADLPSIREQQRVLRELIALYRAHMWRLPGRARFEEDLRNAEKEFNALKSAGQGEQINSERNRLKELTVPVLVVGHEEGAHFEQGIFNLETLLAELEAHERKLTVTIVFPISFEAKYAELLTLFGIDFQTFEPQAAESQPATDPVEQSAAPASGEPAASGGPELQ